MDDIFIFSNNIESLEYVQNIYREELFEFKLNINNEKSHTYSSPFFDDQVWKVETKKILYKFRESFKTNQEDKEKEEWILKKNLIYNNRNIFETLRIILIKNRNQINYITSYIMTYIDRNLEIIINYIKNGRDEIKENNVVLLIDFISYFASFNLSSNNTIKLCKIFITLFNKFKNEFNNIEDFIYKKSFEIIKYNKRKFVDIQNILVMLTFIEKDLPEEILLAWLEQEKNYFRLVVISFYLSTTSRRYRYKKSKDIINSIISYKADSYIEKDNSGVDIESLLYDFDIILLNDFYNCPIVTKKTKDKIREIIKKISTKTPKGKIQQCYFMFIKDFSNSFINWNVNIEDITKVILMKSKYVSSNPY
jgi:hypothetical protein